MNHMGERILIFAEFLCLSLLLFPIIPSLSQPSGSMPKLSAASNSNGKKYIHWVDFNVTEPALSQTFRYDVNSCQSSIHFNWIELLACLGARYGGDFNHYSSQDLTGLIDRLKEGESMDSITSGMKYYPYYLEAYTAVLGGMVGYYEIQIDKAGAPSYAVPDELDTSKVWVKKYGLKVFHPIAAGYEYSDYDDFGQSRNYGYPREHLGHDMMGQIGTPIIAVESGYVEALGWNQYGGWRVGIRTLDQKRYYYYAHLRQNYPYHKSLSLGHLVNAGDVIGYMGHTGYSNVENTNNIDSVHLHLGIQLIFDESQKDGNNQIWINCYELVKFLTLQRAQVLKNQDTKEYNRIYQMRDSQE